MSLFLVITSLSLIAFNAGEIFKPLIHWLYKTSNLERTLLLQKAALKDDQIKLSMTEAFAKYSKLQRKINTIDQELAELQNNRLRNSIMVGMFCTYIIRFVVGLILSLLGIYYRSTLLLHVNKQYDLFPLTGLISFPTGVDNAVSVPFWIMCCTAVGTLIKIAG